MEVYETCPPGFVIPDHPGDGRNEMVPNSNCAFACQSAIYTPAEWDMFRALSLWLSILGIIMISAIIFCLRFDFIARNSNQMVLSICVVSFIHTFASLFVWSVPFADHFCRDNANGYRASDGFTRCSMSAFINFFTTIAMCFCWMFHIMDIMFCLNSWLKQGTVLFVDTSNSWLKKYLPITLVASLIPVSAIFINRSEGYSRGYMVCLIADNPQNPAAENIDIFWFFLPVVAFSLIGALCLMRIWFLFFIHRVKFKAYDLAIEDTDAPKSTFFAFAYLFIWTSYFIGRLHVLRNIEGDDAAMMDWAKCVFEHYDETSLVNNYELICGRNPPGRADIWAIVLSIIISNGQAIGISISFSPYIPKRRIVDYLKQTFSFQQITQIAPDAEVDYAVATEVEDVVGGGGYDVVVAKELEVELGYAKGNELGSD